MARTKIQTHHPGGGERRWREADDRLSPRAHARMCVCVCDIDDEEEEEVEEEDDHTGQVKL